MRSDTNQLDLLRDSPERQAQQWREAAETSRQQYPDDVRRYTYYLREARAAEARVHGGGE